MTKEEPSFSWGDRDGCKTLVLRGGWSDCFAEPVMKESFNALEIWYGEWGAFEFLDLLSNKVKRVKVNGYAGPLEGLERLRNLEYLTLPLDGAPRKPPDLSCFKQLKSVALYWHKKYVDALGLLKELKSVAVFGYSEEDCGALGRVSDLEDIAITRGRLRTLEGLQALRRLKKLELSYLRELKDVAAIQKQKDLTYLWIENAQRLGSLEPICGLHNLETLYLYNCGQLESASWLKNLTKVRKLWIPIPLRARLDWEAVLALPALELIAIQPRSDDVISDAEILAILQKIRRPFKQISRMGTKKAPIIGVEFGSLG